jgi:hypothetical protein
MIPAGAPWIADFVAALRDELALHLHPRGLEMLRSHGVRGSGAQARERAARPGAPLQSGPEGGLAEPGFRTAMPNQARGDAPVVASSVLPGLAPEAVRISSNGTGSPGVSMAPVSPAGPGRVTGRIVMTYAVRPGQESGPGEASPRERHALVVALAPGARADRALHAAAALPAHDSAGAVRPLSWPVARIARLAQPDEADVQGAAAADPPGSPAVLDMGGHPSAHPEDIVIPAAGRQVAGAPMRIPVAGVERLDAAPAAVARIGEPHPDTDVSLAALAAGDVAAGDVAAGDVAAGEVAAGDVAADEVAADEVAADEVAAGDVAADEVAAATVPPGRSAIGHVGEIADSSMQEPGSPQWASWDTWPEMESPTAISAASAQPAAPSAASAPPAAPAQAPVAQVGVVRAASTLPSPWRMPAPAAAQAAAGLAAAGSAPAVPRPAARLQPSPDPLGQHHPVEPVSHADDMPTGMAGGALAPSLEPVPWPRSSMPADAPDPVHLDDDELARHLLRILIAEARREGLEL